jgi:hypothetical protein
MTSSTVIAFALGAVFGGMVTFVFICLILWGNKI